MSSHNISSGMPVQFADPIPLSGRILLLDWSGIIPPPFFPAGPTEQIYSNLDLLSESQFASLAPDVVLCPLFAERWDAVQIAERLSQLGYRGTIYAIGPRLPNPKLVEDEVRLIAPDIDFHLIAERE